MTWLGIVHLACLAWILVLVDRAPQGEDGR